MLGLVLATAALGGAAALAVHGFWIEPRRLVVTRLDVTLPGWPAGAPELRVAVLADFHAAGPHVTAARLAGIVAQTNAERPDLVALLGDYVFETRLRTSFVPPEAVAAALAGLDAPLGVFGVLGNHDWRLDGPRTRRELERAGVVVLENDARRIEAGGVALWVAGLADPHTGRHDLPGTLARVGDDDAPVVLLSHSPDAFPAVPERVALTLAGHTHGGQVDPPLVGPLYVPSRHGRRYLRGHVAEGGRQMFVSSGIGTTFLPVRFRVPPEIVVLTLRGADG